MVTRLSASDASFYHLEDTSTPMYVGSLSILRRPKTGLSYETLLRTVEQRLPQIPRYRQKVREVTFGLARPVWIDDPDFDITYHVRRSALPSPGGDDQLQELVARLASRPLDRSRPLWEMYLVEGLAKNRLAIYTKSHQALVNGMTALEIGHVIADRTQRPPEFGEDIWIPAHEPSNLELVMGAVGDWVTRPTTQLDAIRTAVNDVVTNAGYLADVGRQLTHTARTVLRGTAPDSPLNTQVSRNRRFTVATARLEDYRKLRARYDCDVNDVVLAVVAGALRNWLMSRGEPVTTALSVRAMAPMSVYPEADLETNAGPGQAISEVSPFPGGSAGGRGQSGGATLADRPRHRKPSHRLEPGGCPHDRHLVGLPAADAARDGHPGRHQLLGAGVQPVDDECAWAAVADVHRGCEAARDVRRAAAAAQPGAGYRSHLVLRDAVLRHQRRPRRDERRRDAAHPAAGISRRADRGRAVGRRRYHSPMGKKKAKNNSDNSATKLRKIPADVYESELFRLQTEFVKLQEWTRHTGARIVVLFEGRDAAGKGGTIKRITEYLSPRVVRIEALPAPSDRERGQWYFQRYVAQLPARGEIVLFDRSWYNRAGVEKVMKFCTPQEHSLFLEQVPIFENMLIDDGILLRKYWFSVSDAEQLRRFRSRLTDPVRQWKLSTMDLESVYRWEDYSRARDEMMVVTDTPRSPWYVVESDSKKSARLNMMAHLLSTIEYEDMPQPKVKLPAKPVHSGTYERPPRHQYNYVPDHAARLVGDPEAV